MKAVDSFWSLGILKELISLVPHPVLDLKENRR